MVNNYIFEITLFWVHFVSKKNITIKIKLRFFYTHHDLIKVFVHLI